MTWLGVWPAITTPFAEDGSVDLPFFARHVRRLLDSGCSGVVVLGSLGEAPALTREEKEAIVRTAVEATGDSRRVISGASGYSTAEVVAWAATAVRLGAGGLMVLPPYVYRGDAREIADHFAAVFGSVSLPMMLYNNPIAYGTDVPPSQVAELVRDHPNLVAIKESSGDLRRFTELAHALPRPLDLFVGIDDQLVEGVALGATGWVAGLANALPRESVALFDRARADPASARELYRWFLPLLRMDTDVKLVQKIKLVQAEVGLGSPRVRAPRRELDGAERSSTLQTIRERLATRPDL